jgi:hypothetical protein
MHNHLRTMSMPALRILSFGLVLSTAMVAGCDSSQDPTTPEAKKLAEATRENIRKADEQNSELLKKAKGGKNAPSVHNIKGGIKPAE